MPTNGQMDWRTDRRSDGHEEADSSFSQFCERLKNLFQYYPPVNSSTWFRTKTTVSFALLSFLLHAPSILYSLSDHPRTSSRLVKTERRNLSLRNVIHHAATRSLWYTHLTRHPVLKHAQFIKFRETEFHTHTSQRLNKVGSKPVPYIREFTYTRTLAVQNETSPSATTAGKSISHQATATSFYTTIHNSLVTPLVDGMYSELETSLLKKA